MIRAAKTFLLRPACWFALVTTVVGAGCTADRSDFEQATHEIINGKADTADSAILLALAQTSAQTAELCTATLISPKVLLLAAHCVTGGQINDATTKFFVAQANTLTDVTSKRVPLIPVQARAFDSNYNNMAGSPYDFGVVVLSNPLPVSPVPLNRGATMEGEPVRYVGYGISDLAEARARALGMVPQQSSAGTKREATATLGPMARGSTRVITVNYPQNNVCSGDSGGPLLIKRDGVEKVAGVASTTLNGCQGPADYGLVDQELAWIDEQIRKFDPGGATGDGGVVDPGTRDASADVAPRADALVPTTPPTGSMSHDDASSTPIAMDAAGTNTSMSLPTASGAGGNTGAGGASGAGGTSRSGGMSGTGGRVVEPSAQGAAFTGQSGCSFGGTNSGQAAGLAALATILAMLVALRRKS